MNENLKGFYRLFLKILKDFEAFTPEAKVSVQFSIFYLILLKIGQCPKGNVKDLMNLQSISCKFKILVEIFLLHFQISSAAGGAAGP